jgi:hypothetical protein
MSRRRDDGARQSDEQTESTRSHSWLGPEVGLLFGKLAHFCRIERFHSIAISFHKPTSS